MKEQIDKDSRKQLKNNMSIQDSELESLKIEFFLKAVSSRKSLQRRWQILEGRTRGLKHSEIAKNLGISTSGAINRYADALEILERPITTPTDRAIEAKRQLYFAKERGNRGKEPSTKSRMLRDWDIFLRRTIQHPPSSIDEIVAVYPNVYQSAIPHIVNRVWQVIGRFKETELVCDQDALNEYMGLTTHIEF